ncbi:MAG: SAM-dependent methyltransferase, partial [Lentisphaerota bacterium]
IFLFDFWYGSAVLHLKPQYKEKLMENDFLRIKRITSPVLKPNLDQVEVNFENIIEDKKSGKIDRIKETHNMRYLFLPELYYFMNQNGLKSLASFEWMTDKDMTLETWNGLIVAKLT